MAFGIEGFNINETPALQRQLQKINALPGYNQALARKAMEQTFAGHAEDQFNKYFRSRRDAAKIQQAQFGLQQAKQQLKLDIEKSDSQQQFRMDVLEQKRDALERDMDDDFMSSILGLGTVGYGIYNRRKEEERYRDYKYQRDLGGAYIPAE